MTIEQQRDEARQEAARLREALQKIATGRITGEPEHSSGASKVRAQIAQAALQSAPPASEPEKYEHLGDYSAVEPWHRVLMSCDRCKVTWDGCWDNYQCPRCGEGELPWQPDPAPADRPEPSEAQQIHDAMLTICFHWPDEECPKEWETVRQAISHSAPAVPDEQVQTHGAPIDPAPADAPASEAHTGYEKSINRHLSQPAPAVPEIIKRLPEELERYAAEGEAGAPYHHAATKMRQAIQIAEERALATHPADSDSSAVPDGYVLVPKEPTDSMKIAGIDVSPMHREYYLGTFSSKGRRASLDTDQCDEIYRAMIAAAPTPDGGEP